MDPGKPKLPESVFSYQIHCSGHDPFVPVWFTQEITDFRGFPVDIITGGQTDIANIFTHVFDGKKGNVILESPDEIHGILNRIGIRESVAQIAPDFFIVGEFRKPGRIGFPE